MGNNNSLKEPLIKDEPKVNKPKDSKDEPCCNCSSDECGDSALCCIVLGEICKK